jgi:hypothetical protein
MKIDASYAELLTRHPDDVAKIVAKIREGKSKRKGTDPSTWQWTYQWGQTIDAFSFADLRDPKRLAPPVLTLEQAIEKRLSRCTVWIQARVGNARSNSEAISSEVIRGYITASETEALVKRQHAEAMTPEERQNEVARLLGLLSDPKNNTGFMVLSVG